MNELPEAKDVLTSRYIALALIVQDSVRAKNKKLPRVLKELQTASLYLRPNAHTLCRWRTLMGAGDLHPPPRWL